MVLRLGLVVEVSVLELGADVEGKGKFAVSVLSVVVLDRIEHLLSVNEVLALRDNSIADFTNEDNEAGRGVVMVGVLPDKQDSVHNGNEEFGNFGKFKGS